MYTKSLMSKTVKSSYPIPMHLTRKKADSFHSKGKNNKSKTSTVNNSISQ